MSYGFIQDSVNPWKVEAQNKWLVKVRQFQLIRAPEAVRQSFTQLFGSQVTIKQRVFPVSAQQRARDAAVIVLGLLSGATVSAAVIGICSLI